MKSSEVQQVLRVVSRLPELKYPEAPDDFHDVLQAEFACTNSAWIFALHFLVM